MRRWLGRLPRVTLAALLLVSAALALALSTETGLAWLVVAVRHALPPGLTVGAVEGRGIGPLRVSGLRYRGPSLDLRLDTLRLDWRPAALLRGALEVERLGIEGLVVTRLAPAERGGGFPEPLILPVAVRVARLSLDRMELRSAPRAPSLVVDRVRAGLDYARGRLAVTALEVRSPLLDLDGEAHIETRERYPVRASLDWVARPPGLAPVAGKTVLGGDLHRLTVRQSLAPPYALRGRARIAEPLLAPRYELALALEGIKLSELRADWPPQGLHGELRGQGEAGRLALSGELEGLVPGLGSVQASLRGEWRPRQARVEELVLGLAGDPARLTLRGQLDLGEQGYPMRGSGRWSALRWPLKGEPLVSSAQGAVELRGTLQRPVVDLDLALGPAGRVQASLARQGDGWALEAGWRGLAWPEQAARVTSPDGTLTIAGVPSDYRLRGEARLAGEDLPEARIRLEGQGDEGALRLSELAVEALHGVLKGRATLAWRDGASATFDLQGEGIDPGVWASEWPGRLALRLAGEAARAGQGWRAEVRRLEASGVLRGYPLGLRGQGRLDGQDLRLSELRLESGTSSITVEGGLRGHQAELEWRIASPDLSALWPGLAGKLDGSGRLQGALDAPRIVAALTASELAYPGYRAERVSLAADLDASDRGDSHLDLDLRDGALGATRVRSLRVEGRGRASRHALDARLVSDQGEAELALEGTLDARDWRFVLQRARLDYPGLAPWTLEGRADGLVARDAGHARIGNTCWRSGEARLCLEAERSKAGSKAHLELERLPFDYFAARLPAGTQWTGHLEASGGLTQVAEGPAELRVDLRNSAGHLLPAALREHPEAALAFAPGSGHLRLGASGLALDLDLPLADQGGLGLALTLPPGARPMLERPLDGRLKVDLRRLAFVSVLVPELRAVRGRVEGDLRVIGTPRRPGVTGRLRLVDGGAEVEGPGVLLEDVSLELAGTDQGAIRVQGGARSGGGTLRLEGTLDPVASPPVVRARVSGSDFQVLDTEQARVFVSPELRLGVAGREVDLEGTLRVPRARIQLRELPAGAVSASPDEVIVGGDATAPPEPPYRTRARVRLILGQDVRFSGLGLKADLQGNLLLDDRPGQVTRASGEVRVTKGRYKAYGQDLSIERGRLLFAGGPVSEPGLDVRAVRRPAPDILVGVEAKGTLRRPRLTVFSEPEMSQQERLSYLVLGRPLAPQGADAEQDQLRQAALALGLGGGGLLAEGLGQRLGLDEAGVETGGGAEEAALVVGKYLSPRLYVSYGVGIFDPVSTVRLRYTLNRRWKVETESSATGSGVDVFFTLER